MAKVITCIIQFHFDRGFRKLLTSEAWSEQLGSKVTNWLKIYNKQGPEKVRFSTKNPQNFWNLLVIIFNCFDN